MVDSHCHLADEAFEGDLEAVIRRATGAGVECALVILAAEDSAEAARAQRIEELWPDVRYAVGVHPHQAAVFGDDPERAAIAVRGQLDRTPLARAVGEIGLDYHYDFSPQDVQRAVFRVQVRLARELRRPIVVHTRDADTDTIAILREEGGGEVPGVLHCFTGDAALAHAGLELGLYISVAGIITFPKAAALRETLRMVPVDRLLTETDSPFLAPVPHRGRRNEPAHVVHVVDSLAMLHGMPRADLAARTGAAFHRLFGA